MLEEKMFELGMILVVGLLIFGYYFKVWKI